MDEMTNDELLYAYENAVGMHDGAGTRTAAKAAANLSELRAAVLARMGPPPGWKLVPVEPTDAMKRASRLTHELVPGNEVSRITMWGCNAWAAMLDAAPDAPERPDHA